MKISREADCFSDFCLLAIETLPDGKTIGTAALYRVK